MEFEQDLIKRYGLTPDDAHRIVNRAKAIYYGLKYPFEPLANESTHPINSFVAKNWISMACDELVERLGFNSAVGYKENGMSWTFDNAQLSNRLVSMIIPTARTI